MWPWGHLAVGYLCYVAWNELPWTTKREQTLCILVGVAIGSQFPDVIDKPLAWTIPLLPSGRSLAHSLVVATVVIWGVYRLSYQYRQTGAAIAFGVGYVSHSLADLGPTVLWGILQGDWGQLQWATYLLWPVLPVPPYPQDHSFLEHIAAFELDPYGLFQLGLFGVAVAVWLGCGAPGWRGAKARVARFTKPG